MLPLLMPSFSPLAAARLLALIFFAFSLAFMPGRCQHELPLMPET